MSLDNQQINTKNSPPCQVGAQSRSQEKTSCVHSGVNSLAAVAIAISKHDEVNLQQSQQLPSMSTSSQMIADLARSSYSSGIDKLLLASMVGDTTSSSSRSHSTSNMPTYSSNSSMQQNMAMSMPQMFAAPPPQQQLFLAPSATAAQVPYIPVGRGIGSSGGGLNYSSNSMMSSATRESMMNIPTPRNKSELELYKLLEKANLLNYFGTFLSCGGDDVQQLSDADEEEFLEIMTLIGMTQKPLHVRRLQRALYEWREGRGEIFDSPYKRPNPNNMSGAPQGNSYHFIGRHQQQQSPASHHLRSAHHHLNYTSGLHNLHQQQQTFNGNYNDNERNQSRSSTTIMVESPAPTPNSISSSQALTTSDLNTTSNSSTMAPQPQYSSPHEVLIGAPKRPRLMDSIRPRDLTKLITVDDLEEDKLGSDAN